MKLSAKLKAELESKLRIDADKLIPALNKKHSKEWIESMYKSSDEGIGWELVNYILGKNANDPGFSSECRFRQRGGSNFHRRRNTGSMLLD